MRKMKIIHKISFSAIFIALGIVLSRFVSLPYLFGLSFLKIGFTPSVVMFSSFFLGPFWGLFVGSAIDIIGALAFPQGGSFNILYTIAAALEGLMPYLIYRLFNREGLKNSVNYILVFMLYFLWIFFLKQVNSGIQSESGKKTYILENWQQLILILGTFVLCGLLLFGVTFVKSRFKNKKINQYYEFDLVALSLFITYFVFKIPVGSLVQSFLMNWSFEFIFASRTLVGLIMIFIHLFLVSLALNVSTLFRFDNKLIKRD